MILRYRLERALIADDLKVADVPGAWNEMFAKLLGRGEAAKEQATADANSA